MLAVFDGAKAPDFPDSPGLIVRPGLFAVRGVARDGGVPGGSPLAVAAGQRAVAAGQRAVAAGRRGETLLMGFFTPLRVTAVVHM